LRSSRTTKALVSLSTAMGYHPTICCSKIAMGLASRATDIGIGIGLAGIALAISPLGLRIATGRLNLNLRIEVLSLTLAVFLLIYSGAFVSCGRARRAFFYLIVWSFPLALLAAVEAGAVAVRLSEWIAPTEDKSILNEKDRRSPPYLMSAGRFTRRDGVMLYKPWRGDGIAINEVGLRTKSPTPKQLGEWRIAVTGVSAVWGAYVLDVDTIPVQLQQLLDRSGHHDISVYNFGIEAIDIAGELAVLRRFRELYSIDQVIFYTGGNDATQSLTAITPPDTRPPPLLDHGNSLELIKVVAASMMMPLIVSASDTPSLSNLWYNACSFFDVSSKNAFVAAIITGK
jgi:hypothetical protein